MDHANRMPHLTPHSGSEPIPQQPSALADTVSARLTTLVLDVAAHVGVSPHETAFISDLAAGQDNLDRVPTSAQHRLWEIVHASGGPGVGLQAARLAEVGRLHVWDYMLTSAPTLAEGFVDAAQYLSTVADPALVLTVISDGPRLTVGYYGARYSEAVDWQISEFALALLLRRAREARGAAATPVRVGFAHRAPARHAYLVDEFGTGNIHFDQDADTLTFLDPDRAGSGIAGDPELSRIMRVYARSIMASARPARSWLENFRDVLLMVLSTGPATGTILDDVAQRLSVSPRTLQRRLAEHGTSGRAEIESVRHDRAVRLLLDTELPVGSIAGQLGYSDHRAMGRAFRRWTGQTPDAYRRCARN
ncbi:helix-turn-helix domain-containing protein [Nocardia sp. NPDC056100]|uniref:helix-turn-helix transcriptional regulator n=1 Tax=Nocardia sp. NPDC056100 TaxID=3345712 RepID=UPI0035D91728